MHTSSMVSACILTQRWYLCFWLYCVVLYNLFSNYTSKLWSKVKGFQQLCHFQISTLHLEFICSYPKHCFNENSYNAEHLTVSLLFSVVISVVEWRILPWTEDAGQMGNVRNGWRMSMGKFIGNTLKTGTDFSRIILICSGGKLFVVRVLYYSRF